MNKQKKDGVGIFSEKNVTWGLFETPSPHSHMKNRDLYQRLSIQVVNMTVLTVFASYFMFAVIFIFCKKSESLKPLNLGVQLFIIYIELPHRQQMIEKMVLVKTLH